MHKKYNCYLRADNIHMFHSIKLVNINKKSIKFFFRYITMIFTNKILYPHDTMVERMVGSTSSFSNVYGIVDDNINHYKNMIMDVMRMNHGHVSQCPIVDEELNADATMFFYLFKYSNKPLWDSYTNHCKLLIVVHVFTIKSDHGLSNVSDDRIVEWARSILP